MAGIGNIADLAGVLATTVALAGSPQAKEVADFSGLVELDKPEVTTVINNTQSRIVPLTEETKPILLAQANIEDGRTWPYYVEIIMVGGWKKKIKFYRNNRWAAIPPPVENGKLMDGSKAPIDAIEARIAQRELMTKYDKWAQTALAMVGSRDLMQEAHEKIDILGDALKKWLPITRESLSEAFFWAYILILSWRNVDEIMKTSELVGIKLLKMTPSEVTKMKQNAEEKAKAIWKSTTWAILAS